MSGMWTFAYIFEVYPVISIQFSSLLFEFNVFVNGRPVASLLAYGEDQLNIGAQNAPFLKW